MLILIKEKAYELYKYFHKGYDDIYYVYSQEVLRNVCFLKILPLLNQQL